FLIPPPPRSTLFPYTTLFRSRERHRRDLSFRVRFIRSLHAFRRSRFQLRGRLGADGGQTHAAHGQRRVAAAALRRFRRDRRTIRDRKSTRLNSSHRTISYAVF